MKTIFKIALIETIEVETDSLVNDLELEANELEKELNELENL